MQNLAPDHKNTLFLTLTVWLFPHSALEVISLWSRKSLETYSLTSCTISPHGSESVHIIFSLLSNPIQPTIQYPKYTHSWVREKTKEAHQSNREPPMLPVCPCLLPLRRMKAMPSKACTDSYSVLSPQTQLFCYSENRMTGQPMLFPPCFPAACWQGVCHSKCPPLQPAVRGPPPRLEKIAISQTSWTQPMSLASSTS